MDSVCSICTMKKRTLYALSVRMGVEPLLRVHIGMCTLSSPCDPSRSVHASHCVFHVLHRGVCNLCIYVRMCVKELALQMLEVLCGRMSVHGYVVVEGCAANLLMGAKWMCAASVSV